MNAGWAAHVVHHQSEEYNLTVALRQGAFQPAFSWVFYLPLAVLGFPPAMFLAVSSFNTLYQFWIHTRLIGRLGPLEWVLNTPSHHRVHHGRNPRYIDRNHGGTLIVWDRLFGTFERGAGRARLRHHEAARELQPALGQRPLLGRDVGRGAAGAATPRQAAGALEEAGLAAGRPGRPVGPSEVDRRTHVPYEVPLPLGLRLYVLVQFALVNLATVAFLYQAGRLGPGARAAGALLLAWSLTSLGGLLDRRPWAAPLELGRLGAGAARGLRAAPVPPVALAVGALAAASALWLLRSRKKRLPLPAGLR